MVLHNINLLPHITTSNDDLPADITESSDF